MGRLPESIRRFARRQASAVAFFWELDLAMRPRDLNLPEELWGRFSFDVRELPALEQYRREVMETRYGDVDLDADPDPDMDTDFDEEGRRWHRSLVLQVIDNGDVIVFDRGGGVDDCGVFYVAHAEWMWLGRDFAEFIETFTLLGCPGPESWQWDSFVTAATLRRAGRGAPTSRPLIRPGHETDAPSCAHG
jgi:hypothetical protein